MGPEHAITCTIHHNTNVVKCTILKQNNLTVPYVYVAGKGGHWVTGTPFSLAAKMPRSLVTAASNWLIGYNPGHCSRVAAVVTI